MRGWRFALLLLFASSALAASQDNAHCLLSSDGSCVDESLHVMNESRCCSIGPDQTIGGKNQASFESLTKSILCSKPFDRQAWDAVTPLPKHSELREADAIQFLLRFQKPGGLEVPAHLPVLLAILKSDLVAKHPTLISGALFHLEEAAPSVYKNLLSYLPSLSEIHAPVQTDNLSCRTEQEQQQFQSDLALFIEKQKPAKLTEIAPLQGELAKLPQDTKIELEDKITRNEAYQAESGDYRGVFQSELYYFAYQPVAKIFGDSASSLTDVTTIATEENITPIELGSEPFEPGQTPNAYGFYSQKQESISKEKLFADGRRSTTLSLSWDQSGKAFHAAVELKLETITDVVPADSSPKYSELWRKGVLTGAVLTGSNLGDKSRDVMNEYLQYYQDEGFSFVGPTPIPNLKNYLSDKIQSGEIGYLIKEAHSDGDEKNLFRANANSLMVTGTRTLFNGKQEVVYLIYPEKGSPKGELLSNEEFGSWIQGRDKNHGGQMIYLNTSCWSAKESAS